ncbi:MAG: WhiB family transcriptional regulator [Egibacteraceae bacterium]
MDQCHYLSESNPPDQSFETLGGWRTKAACLDEDPELFFPVGVTGPALDQIEQAKAVCQRCPVVDDCLEWALETNQQDGIWGGLSEDQRRTLRRRRGRCRKP